MNRVLKMQTMQSMTERSIIAFSCTSCIAQSC